MVINFCMDNQGFIISTDLSTGKDMQMSKSINYVKYVKFLERELSEHTV